MEGGGAIASVSAAKAEVIRKFEKGEGGGGQENTWVGWRETLVSQGSVRQKEMSIDLKVQEEVLDRKSLGFFGLGGQIISIQIRCGQVT